AHCCRILARNPQELGSQRDWPCALHLCHSERPARICLVELHLLAPAVDLGSILAGICEGVKIKRSTRLGSAIAKAPARIEPDDSPNIKTDAFPVTCSTNGRAALRSSRSQHQSCRRCAKRTHSRRDPLSIHRNQERQSDPWPNSQYGREQ